MLAAPAALEQHFRGLYTSPTPWEPPPAREGLTLTPALTASELRTILETRFRSGGSSGLCPVPTQCVRFLPPTVLERLAPWLSTLLGRGLPAPWHTASLVPIWKGKGSPEDPSKHRGI